MFIQEAYTALERKEFHIQKSVIAWQSFLKSFDWQSYVAYIKPKTNGCGIVYEFPNLLEHDNESFAICDMKDVAFTEPHYHPIETEVYIVLQGTALIVIAGEELHVKKEDVVIIESNKAHFTIPDQNFVIAVINIPAFRPDGYIPLTDTNNNVGFCKKQFDKIIS